MSIDSQLAVCAGSVARGEGGRARAPAVAGAVAGGAAPRGGVRLVRWRAERARGGEVSETALAGRQPGADSGWRCRWVSQQFEIRRGQRTKPVWAAAAAGGGRAEGDLTPPRCCALAACTAGVLAPLDPVAAAARQYDRESWVARSFQDIIFLRQHHGGGLFAKLFKICSTKCTHQAQQLHNTYPYLVQYITSHDFK